MKVSLLALATLTASVASAYPITGDEVKCRSGPGTSYSVKKTYAKNTDVTLKCQTKGETISGNNIWDKTQDDCYVTDYYVKTGTNGYVVDKCEGGGDDGGDDGGDCGPPKVNKATVDLIAKWEGFRADIYEDATGNPTVGYGHLCSDWKCSDVSYSIPLSVSDGKKLLAKDIARFEKCIAGTVDAKLNANQYGAIVSWSYNCGCPAAQGSQLVKRVNKGQNVNTVVAEEMPKWVHDNNGNPIQGLVNRRKDEVALAKKATTDKGLPAEC